MTPLETDRKRENVGGYRKNQDRLCKIVLLTLVPHVARRGLTDLNPSRGHPRPAARAIELSRSLQVLRMSFDEILHLTAEVLNRRYTRYA